MLLARLRSTVLKPLLSPTLISLPPYNGCAIRINQHWDVITKYFRVAYVGF